MPAAPILTLAVRPACDLPIMHGLRAAHPDGLPRRRPPLRVVGHDDHLARRAWWSLTVALVVVLAMWAVGVVVLPETSRRIVDASGGIAVLATLVAWVRRNTAALACESESRSSHGPLTVRIIRSRRPPLREIGGPEIRPVSRRRSATDGRRAS
jgi:hypothetical protein